MTARHFLEFEAPWWLPGGHLQTIWPALLAKRVLPAVRYQRSRWTLSDGDFIDVDWLRVQAHNESANQQARPLLVLFHGLEGASTSHYALAFAHFAHDHSMDYAVPHFRGCSGEINHAPRAYHSGDFAEVDQILRRLRTEHKGPLLAVGVSMGGNALLRWAQEIGNTPELQVHAIASVGAPMDLQAAGAALSIGLNKYLYTPMFLRSMKPKAFEKLRQYPGLFDADAMRQANSLYAFDNLFTAPLHGYKNTDDYWLRASAKPHLHRIKVPTLLLNARNDPFVPFESVRRPASENSYLTWWQPRTGGHIGFWQGPIGHRSFAMAWAVGAWLKTHLNC